VKIPAARPRLKRPTTWLAWGRSTRNSSARHPAGSRVYGRSSSTQREFRPWPLQRGAIVFDNRLKAEEVRTERYSFRVPDDARSRSPSSPGPLPPYPGSFARAVSISRLATCSPRRTKPHHQPPPSRVARSPLTCRLDDLQDLAVLEEREPRLADHDVLGGGMPCSRAPPEDGLVRLELEALRCPAP